MVVNVKTALVQILSTPIRRPIISYSLHTVTVATVAILPAAVVVTLIWVFSDNFVLSTATEYSIHLYCNIVLKLPSLTQVICPVRSSYIKSVCSIFLWRRERIKEFGLLYTNLGEPVPVQFKRKKRTHLAGRSNVW